MKQKILLINKSGLSLPFQKAIKEEGFDVVSFFDEQLPNFEKTLFQKFNNIFRRKFLDDKTYLQRVEKSFIEKQYIKRCEDLKSERFDYALFFRADLYPEKMIQNIRKISSKMVTDQYDGMEVCGKIIDYLPYFDRLFVFDPDDFKKYKDQCFLPITNCWFPDTEKISEITQDFFYIGVGTDDRQQKIINFQKAIAEKYSLKAVLTVPHFREEKEIGSVNFLHKGLSYSENMKQLKSSKCLIDFKLNYHTGLSFRFFEAMYYGKKIITDNTTVKKYDFYNPANIFVTDYKNFDGLEEFLATPIEPIEPKILEKYGFKNWIHYVLNLAAHQKIELPQ